MGNVTNKGLIIEKSNEYVVRTGKKLRCGYTTGSCAAAATKAGAIMLLEKNKVEQVQLVLISGQKVEFQVKDILQSNKEVSCAVMKDAGDDPDITHGIKIYAKVMKIEEDIFIDGGIGVGRVMVDGLPCRKGEAAINPVPKQMICTALLETAKEYGYEGGFKVEIYVPEGVEIAKKTFNKRIGIENGISIIGTTGVVEPMSESAIIDTIKLHLRIKKQNGQKVCFIAPGNYGLEFAKMKLGLDIDSAVKCSNFIGEALDFSLYLEFEKLLLVGHIGKLVKLAGGVMNTHSKIADCRNEIFAAHCGLLGADSETIKDVMNAKTTNQIHGILVSKNLSKNVYKSILEKILFNLNYRVMDKMQIELVVFSDENGVLMKTQNAEKFINELKGKMI